MLAQPCLSLSGQKPGIQFAMCSICMLSVDVVFFCSDVEFILKGQNAGAVSL